MDGTPGWAVACARGAVASVIPSAVWRTLVGIGVPLGWSQEQLDLERIPGQGTIYVIALSVLSIAAASLTLGLVRPWGDRVPASVPGLGGRRIPTSLVVLLSGAGIAAVSWIVIGSIVNWSSVSGFAERPTSGWALLMLACYLPAALWPVLLAAATIAFVHRRRSTPPQ